MSDPMVLAKKGRMTEIEARLRELKSEFYTAKQAISVALGLNEFPSDEELGIARVNMKAIERLAAERKELLATIARLKDELNMV